MKIVKKLIAVLAISAISLSVVACGSNTDTTAQTTESTGTTANSEKDTTVIATVEGTPIYKSAFDEEMAYVEYMMTYQYGEDYKDNEEAMAAYNQQKQDILQYLIESQVLLEKAKSLDIKATDEEIEEEINTVKAQFESEDKFNEALEQSGLTLDELKKQAEERLIISKMVTEGTKDVTATEDEAKAYYDENINSYTTGAGANMAHILVETEDEAKKVKAEYDAGTSFEDLAAQYGTDGTKDKGGALGFIEYDSPNYDADFLAGAKGLAEGEVSDPVKTQFGWHLIKVTDVQKDSVTKSFEEVKDEVLEQVKEEKSYQVFNDNLDKWKSEMKIETFENRL
nr:peptidyl-prolyl cis-trans isomerase [uncultured Cellulosilyticum sp.]